MIPGITVSTLDTFGHLLLIAFSSTPIAEVSPPTQLSLSLVQNSQSDKQIVSKWKDPTTNYLQDSGFLWAYVSAAIYIAFMSV